MMTISIRIIIIAVLLYFIAVQHLEFLSSPKHFLMSESLSGDGKGWVVVLRFYR